MRPVSNVGITLYLGVNEGPWSRVGTYSNWDAIMRFLLIPTKGKRSIKIHLTKSPLGYEAHAHVFVRDRVYHS